MPSSTSSWRRGRRDRSRCRPPSAYNPAAVPDGRRRGFPQIIHSSKRFQGPTGLEEYLGYGIGMSLAVHVEDGAIVFRSVDYFIDVLGHRWILPAFLKPGDLTIKHAENGTSCFTFTLVLEHRWLGPLIRQRAIFREVVS